MNGRPQPSPHHAEEHRALILEKVMPRRRFLYYCLLVLPFWTDTPAWAITRLEVKVAVRTLAYVRGLERGPITMALVFDSSDPEARAESREFIEILARLENPGRDLTVVPVTVDEFLQESRAYQVVFIIGVRDRCRAIFEIASVNRQLTLTNNMQYFDENCSVLGFKAEGVIEIYLNERSWKASGVKFDPVFLYMIKRK